MKQKQPWLAVCVRNDLNQGIIVKGLVIFFSLDRLVTGSFWPVAVVCERPLMADSCRS
ncbi:hypothetical protein [Pseudomonas kribbensis]|uniref:hypothetical protein n=1 Tax=Pseudomonas kribbensis TaxID=1628086 RepID=UPI00143180B7|nr:hypothetical protein [Pseudomonas kribbensis]